MYTIRCVCKFLVLSSDVIMLWLADVSMKAESIDAGECDKAGYSPSWISRCIFAFD